jgi:hypothetical protein
LFSDFGQGSIQSLNRIDENIANYSTQGSNVACQRSSRVVFSGDGVAMTPDVDFLLDKFVTRLLLKEKATEERLAASQDAEEGSMFTPWDPRGLWKSAAAR